MLTLMLCNLILCDIYLWSFSLWFSFVFDITEVIPAYI